LRHGRSWLDNISTINRIRTLLKNASLPFLLRTTPRTVIEVSKLVWSAQIDGVKRLSVALQESRSMRGRVTSLAKASRRDVERAWTAKPDPDYFWRRG
jgi:hypothetical protein